MTLIEQYHDFSQLTHKDLMFSYVSIWFK